MRIEISLRTLVLSVRVYRFRIIAVRVLRASYTDLAHNDLFSYSSWRARSLTLPLQAIGLRIPAMSSAWWMMIICFASARVDIRSLSL